MSLGDLLEKKLDLPGSGEGSVQVESDSGAVAQVDVLDSDRLGATVDRVRVTVPEAAPLQQQADAITGRVRELGGRLIPVEVDERLGGGRLRTRKKDLRGGRFFEVDLDGEGATVDRFKVGEDGGRSRQPYTLTREQLGRLVDDLADGLAGHGDED